MKNFVVGLTFRCNNTCCNTYFPPSWICSRYYLVVLFSNWAMAWSTTKILGWRFIRKTTLLSSHNASPGPQRSQGTFGKGTWGKGWPRRSRTVGFTVPVPLKFSQHHSRLFWCYCLGYGHWKGTLPFPGKCWVFSFGFIKNIFASDSAPEKLTWQLKNDGLKTTFLLRW